MAKPVFQPFTPEVLFAPMALNSQLLPPLKNLLNPLENRITPDCLKMNV